MKDLMFISIKPKYLELILEGSKTIELRKCKPSSFFDSYIILYATNPEKKVVGICELVEIIETTPEEMWISHSDQLGINKNEFFTYYSGSNTAIGLKIKNVIRIDKYLSLETIKNIEPSFSPPQTYKYIPFTFILRNFKDSLSEVASKINPSNQELYRTHH